MKNYLYKYSLNFLLLIINILIFSTYCYKSNSISSFYKNNLKANSLIKYNKHFKMYNYLKNFYESKVIDCKNINSCNCITDRLKTLDSILIILEDLFLELNNYILNKSNNNKKILNYLNINNPFKLNSRFCNIIKSYPLSVFYIYSSVYYRYINNVLKTYNFKSVVLNKYYKYIKDFKITKTNDELYKKYLSQFIKIIKLLGYYIYKYSNESPNSNCILYRGIKLKEDDLIFKTNLSNNIIVTSPNPLSFTYSKEIAMKYLKIAADRLKLNNKGKLVLFVINNYSNCKGKNLNNSKTSKFSCEKEFLMRPFVNFTFDVDSISEIDDKVINIKYTKINLLCLKEESLINSKYIFNKNRLVIR